MSKEGEEADWILAQKKAFTRWANVYLRMKKRKIDNIYEDLGDGLNLITLLEVIGEEEKLPTRYHANPKMRIHKLENLKAAFDYMKSKGLMMTNMGPTDVADGNSKIILGLMWTIISGFQIGDIMLDGVSGKDGLLLWVQRQTSSYKEKGVDIKNFSGDWGNGMAFCALLHKFRPQALDFDALNPENKLDNVALAFKVAEEWFGVEPLVDPEDVALARKPDEKIIICYISFLFRAFAEITKQDNLVRSIHKALDITRRHDEWIAAYNAQAEELNTWIASTVESYKAEVAGNSLEGIKGTLDAFYTFKREELPPHRSQITALDGRLNTLHSSERNNNRPAWEPAAGVTVGALESAWKGLEDTLDAYETRVRERYAQFEILTNTLTAMHAKADKLNGWTDKQSAFFARAVYGNSWTACETLMEGFKSFEDQSKHQKAVLTMLRGWANDNGMDVHEGHAAANTRLDEVAASFQAMEEAAATYHTNLSAALEKFKKLAVDIKEYNAAATEFSFACEEVEDDLHMPIPATSVAAVQGVIDTFNSTTKGKKEDVEARAAKLDAQAKALMEHEADAFSRYPIEALRARASAVGDRFTAREGELAAALATEQEKEKLRTDFAALASEFKAFCASKQEACRSVSGSLEEQLAGVQALQKEHTDTTDAKLAPLQAAQDALEAHGVVNNEHTPETIHSLRATWSELAKVYAGAAEALQGQVLAAKSGEVTAEQVKEIKEVFEFFDADKDQQLNPAEFHSCATGIGLILTEEEMKEEFARIDLSGDGAIDFNEFTAFMVERLKEPGHDMGQVVEAFRDLAAAGCPDEDCITEAQLKRFFLDEADHAYLTERMPAGPAGEEKTFNYSEFVKTEFTR